MNYKHLFPLLIAPFCCLGEINNSPARDYTMVDLKNGLTTEMLEIGKTSFTFSVEWKHGMKFEEDTLFLMGQLLVLDLEEKWSSVKALYLDPTRWQGRYSASDWYSCFPKEFNLAQRKATFEILYNDLFWHHDKDDKEDFEKKAFFTVRVPVITDSPDGITEWLYEDGGEKAETKGAVGTKRDHHLWLYAGILIGSLCAGFYFLRRKLKTGN